MVSDKIRMAALGDERRLQVALTGAWANLRVALEAAEAIGLDLEILLHEAQAITLQAIREASGLYKWYPDSWFEEREREEKE
jgi:hypothetical protein